MIYELWNYYFRLEPAHRFLLFCLFHYLFLPLALLYFARLCRGLNNCLYIIQIDYGVHI